MGSSHTVGTSDGLNVSDVNKETLIDDVEKSFSKAGTGTHTTRALL